MTFACGHPREPGNIYYRPNDGHEICALCIRIRNICKQQRRDQQRINSGTFRARTLGERIARGLA
jgi:hypothetical protein